MNLIQLKYFEVLAKTEHLSKTAELMYVTPPAIRNSMKSLEEELGTPLFDRIGRNLKLNARGQAFLPYVIMMLQNLEDGKQAVNDVLQQDKRILRFSIRDIAMFTPLFSDFPKFHPDITLQPIEADPDETGNLLWDEKLDFMLTAMDLSSNTRLMKQELYRDHYVLAVSPEHPLANKSRVSLSELKDEIFLYRPKTDYFQNCIDHILEENRFAPEKFTYCNYASRSYMVHSNAGISITTKMAVNNPFTAKMKLLEVDEFENSYYQYYAYFRKDHKLREEEKLFLDAVQDFIKSYA